MIRERIFKSIMLWRMMYNRGPRCPDRLLKGEDPEHPDAECACCRAWYCFDYIFEGGTFQVEVMLSPEGAKKLKSAKEVIHGNLNLEFDDLSDEGEDD